MSPFWNEVDSLLGGMGPWAFLRNWLDSAPWRRPAPERHRCIMGGPVAEVLHCRRRAPYGLWCDRHRPAGES